MNRLRLFLLGGLLLVLGFGFAQPPREVKSPPDVPPPRAQAEQLFATKVLPLLQNKCFACHGNDPKDIRAGLDLRSRKGMLTGGDSGAAVLVPGDVSKSLIVQAVAWDGLKMPPKENDRLTPEQVAWIRQWVAAGAPWPDKTIAQDDKKGVVVKTSGGLTDEWTNRRYDPADLWAYQPAQRPEVPWQAVGGDKKRNPIDAFLNHKLQQATLEPAGRADKRTLIRRATFNLTGLPPTPEEIDAFLKDDAPDAYIKLIDRLLASKHYGEQAARLWLDVVRYADSAGFSNDWERPHAWRYRDYVVRSFNADKPFDRFIKEQLAGDELEPDNAEMLLAVSDLRMGPWEHTGMSVAAVTRQQYLDDITNNVGETFLATGMSCCRCHDHKFDPLPTRDYYRLQAVFAPVQFADRDVPFLSGENTDGLKGEQARIEHLQLGKDDVRLVLDPKASDKEKEEAKLGIKKVQQKRDERWKRNLEFFKPLAMSVYNGPLLVRNVNQPYHPLPKDRKGEVHAVHILTGGSLESPSDKIKTGALSAVAGLGDAIPETMDGRRLALANWLASPKHPLTARVLVNRIWQQHFGKGLAANPNNFGKTGRKPTHPGLLDWLALDFVDNGWSIKKLHRLIMTSETYQRAGEPKDAKAAERLDAEDKLLGWFPPRRLTAEELRDTMLAVSGELNRAQGGLPVRPEINPEVAFQPRHVMGSVAPAYQPSRTPTERNRRTIYALKIRTLRDPGLEVFDQPTPDLSCERRNESTVTPQVFNLFNSQSSHDRALALARRLEKEADTPAGRIDHAFRLAFGRLPTDAERRAALQHVEKMTEHHRKHKPQPVPLPKVIVREKIEEMTGTKVRWEERLDIYENYVSDLKPWNVGPETCALAELCLVLLNANEFLYVY